MLTGRPAFRGDTSPDTVAAILEREPDWSALPAQTPPSIHQLIQRCLEKDAKRRLRDIGDARLEIEAALHPSHEHQQVAVPPGQFARWAAVGVGALAIAIAGAVTWGVQRPASSSTNPLEGAKVVRLTDFETAEEKCGHFARRQVCRLSLGP